MFSIYILYFVLLLIGIAFTINVIQKINEQTRIIKKFEKINDKTKSWKKVKAKILDKSFNTIYFYEKATFDSIKNLVDTNENDFNEQQEKSELSLHLKNQPIFVYGYIVNDEKHISNEISILPSDKNIPLFYQYNKGDYVVIRVNPEDNSDSIIRTHDKAEFKQFNREVYIKNTSLIFTVLFCWIILFSVVLSTI